MGLFDPLKRKARKLGLQFLLSQLLDTLKDAGEGRLGPAWQARYWWWAGKKTWTGVALMLAGVAAEALGQHDAALWITGAGGFLASAGLVERAHRSEIPAAIAESGWYRFLAQHGGLLGGLLVTASAMVPTSPDCSWCLVADKVVLVLGAVAVQVKLIDPAWKSRPPIVDLEALQRYADEDAER